MLGQLIVIQIGTFLAIVFVLRKLLYTETAKEVNRLKQLSEQYVLKQKELRKKLEDAENLYRQKLLSAQEDIKKLRIKFEEDASREKKEIMDKAKQDAEYILKSAFNAKDKIREEASLEVDKKAPMLAAQIFRDALSLKAREVTHKELVKAVVEELKNIDKTRFNAGTKIVELISAFPLEKDDKDEVVSLLLKKLGPKVSIGERQDKTIIAGLIINAGTVVMDGSIDNRLRQLKIVGI